MEFIKTRSEDGIGVKKRGETFENYKFPKYSKEYEKSLAFRVGGKSSSSIDLTLSGDMLASMELLKERRGEITIGYEAGSDENARAEGNQLGTYGRQTPNPRRARSFLGISEADLNKILRGYKDGGSDT